MRGFATIVVTIGVLGALFAVPATAQTAGSGAASAFGVRVLGLVPPTPEVGAEAPPDDAAQETLVEIPADPLLVSATASASAAASEDAEKTASLQEIAAGVNPDLPEAWNVRGDAITEDLEALEGNLTAEVLEAEAVASCEEGNLQLATASRFQEVTLGEEVVPIEELDAIFEGLEPALEGLEPLLGESRLRILADRPNDVILEAPEVGLRIIAWETNWDGASGTVDGSDTVWVNALRISIDEPLAELIEPLGGEPTDIVISQASATADCAGPSAPGPGPLDELAKESSDETVAPGETFSYTITVPNADPSCTLENVAVTDAIDGPQGSQIVDTEPSADQVEGLEVGWDDVGPIAPGEAVALRIEVRVPDDAPEGAVYHEVVEVTGDCDGEEVDGDLTFDGPTVTDPPVAPGGLPRTGGGLSALGLGALLASGGFGLLARQRRSP